MKSYFSKLADRATVANVPAHSPVHSTRVPEPFDETPVAPVQLRSTEPPNLTRTPSESKDLVQSPRRRERAAIEKDLEVVETPQRTALHRSTREESIQPNVLEPREPEFDNAKPIVADNRKDPAENEVQKELDQETVALIPKAFEANPPIVEKPTLKDHVPPDNRVEHRLSEIERDQAALLRHADAFMRNVLDVDRQTWSTRSDQSDETPTLSFPVQTQSPERLEPKQGVRESPAYESNEPSLVIGKLTVEVTPPTQPPPAQQPTRIVVRGSGNRRSAFRPSRSFGLRQF